MTRATWALRALCIVGFAGAVWLWASGRCPWGVAGLAMLAYLAVFLTTLPEPVEWVPASDPQPAPASARCRCGECDGTGQRR